MVYRGMHLLSCSDADLLDEDENGHARILCAMCRGEGVTVLLPCNHACLCRLCFRALCEASRTPQCPLCKALIGEGQEREIFLP